MARVRHASAQSFSAAVGAAAASQRSASGRPATTASSAPAAWAYGAHQSSANPAKAYCEGHYLRELPDAAIDAFLALGNEGGARLAMNHGAIADVPPGASAYSHRDALVEFTTSAGWTDPTEDEARIETTRRYAAGLEPFASGTYVNTLAEAGTAALRRVYSTPDLTRLTTVKSQYDPTNVFHRTHNIQP
ncbi:BBE domain-containing protein [Kribbella qitaiheensis]|uniref:BBE domain-containing protein n=1 Tax=Kribbella qitaiheensis TaxID=1544730 RepID=UPI003608CF51